MAHQMARPVYNLLFRTNPKIRAENNQGSVSPSLAVSFNWSHQKSSMYMYVHVKEKLCIEI